jgi:hypothetical protein
MEFFKKGLDRLRHTANDGDDGSLRETGSRNRPANARGASCDDDYVVFNS